MAKRGRLGHSCPVGAPLDGADAKLARAFEHLEALDLKIAAFFDGHSYGIGSKYDPDASEIVLYATEPTGVPFLSWGVLIGDCVQNLRASLDYIVWQMALRHLKREPTEKEARSIQFPIQSTGHGFKSAAVRQFVSDVDFGRIKEMQPYKRGDRAPFHLLAVLRELSNTDKHRVVLIASLVSAGAQLKFGQSRDIASYGEVEFYFGEPLKEKTPIGRVCDVVATGPDPYIDANGPFNFGVVFNVSSYPALHLESVIKILGQIGELVETIVELFTKEFSEPV